LMRILIRKTTTSPSTSAHILSVTSSGIADLLEVPAFGGAYGIPDRRSRSVSW
jgi:hypothetical protein